MRYQHPSNIRTKIAAAALGALPFIVAVVLPARSEPTVELTPLPWALSSELRATSSLADADPRAMAMGATIGTVVGQIRARAMQAAPVAGGIARRSGNTAAGSRGRKPSSTASFGRARGPGVAIRAEAPDFTVRMAQGGTIRSVQAMRTAALQRAVGSSLADDERTVRAFLKAQQPLLGLAEPDRELRLRTRKSDRLGHRHLRFEQSFEGLPVHGAELIAQLDAGGNLISLNGRYAPTPRKLISRPVVQREQATDLVRSLHPGALDAGDADAELAVFLKDGTTPHLAWIFEAQVGLLESRLVAIDAHSGAVLADFNQVQSASHPGSGVDLFGNLQSLSVWESGGVHYMVDTSKPMYDPASTPPYLGSSRGVIAVLDAQNQAPPNDPQQSLALSWVASMTGANGPWLPDAVSAASNLAATYEYFLTKHSRDSLDDSGGSLVAVVRLDEGFANALFDPSTQTMYFGDGLPFAGTLDVVAHELTHGVVHHSAGLVYLNQSGALNEAFADIFGELVEARVLGQADWLVGSRLGTHFRDMANPAALHFAPGHPYPTRMSEYVYTSQDNGGVHVNSSIVNHAFYLLAAGLPNAIGLDAAGDIFYRTLTTKLTARSDFTDARLGAIQSAAELFGANSPEVERTAEAFDAVQIYDTPTNPLPPPFSGSDGTDATVFVYWDGWAGAHYLGRYDSSLGDVAPGVQLSLNPVSTTKPSVAGDGSFAVFVNAQNDICFIPTDASSDESCIGFPGSTHSVAMSPDASTFAFVLLDGMGNPDNAISVVDIGTGEARTFELVSPTYDGASSIHVLAADALDMTADNRFLVYDAFNALTFIDGPPLGLWSIYAIDLATGTTLALLPPTLNEQGDPLDIAFPSIAQTSDGHMTFDVRDGVAGQNYVFAADVLTGSLAVVGVTSNYSAPGYTGDDAAIVYSVPDGSPTQASLVRRQLAGDRLTPIGTPQVWLPDADYGVVYRRGSFSGPRRVDVSVSQSVTTEPGHRATFRIEVTNSGPDAATAVQLAGLFSAGSTVAVNAGSASCTTVSAGNETSCSVAELQPGAVAIIELTAEVQSAVELTSSVTAFASEPDLNAPDNTSFNSVAAALLNFPPTVQGAIGSHTARVGSPFTGQTASSFADPDSDALSYAATGLPAGLAVDQATGTISGTPAAGADSATPYVVHVTASDGFGGSVVGQHVITVQPAPVPPTTGGSSGGGSSGGSSSGGGGGGGGAVGVPGLLVLLGFGAAAVVRRRGRRGGSACPGVPPGW